MCKAALYCAVACVLVAGLAQAEQKDSVPVAIFQGAQYVDISGRTQQNVRVTMEAAFSAGDSAVSPVGDLRAIYFRVQIPDTHRGVSRWRDYASLWFSTLLEDNLAAIATRAQKWAVESGSKRLSVVDKPLSLPSAKAPSPLFFFAENMGESWGVMVASKFDGSVRFRNEQAEEFCRIIQDLHTPIKRQRVIDHARRTIAELEQATQPTPTGWDNDQLNY